LIPNEDANEELGQSFSEKKRNSLSLQHMSGAFKAEKCDTHPDITP
jgi:hypothetical protein